MQFFCPVCQVVVELMEETTVTTKLGQIYHKAHCQLCKQDLAAAVPVTVSQV